MVKNLSGLVHTVGEKIYHFVCDNDAPLTDVKDALFQFMGQVSKIEDAVKANAAATATAAAAAQATAITEAPGAIYTDAESSVGI